MSTHPASPVLRRAVSVLAAGSLGLQTACFSYRPAGFTTIAPGRDVHIMLTPDGATELAPLLGPRVRQVSGQIQEVLGDTASVVLLDEVTTADGDALPWRRGRVTVPSRAVASAEQRTLDRRKTRMFVGVVAVTFTAVIVAALKKAGYSGSSRSGPGGGPPE